ncbi:MAG: hypothetical protein SFY69_03330 [Planctomycetota bacterium]|nr:hypothetical protein [Planctomycetota bacterium]
MSPGFGAFASLLTVFTSAALGAGVLHARTADGQAHSAPSAFSGRPFSDHALAFTRTRLAPITPHASVTPHTPALHALASVAHGAPYLGAPRTPHDLPGLIHAAPWSAPVLVAGTWGAGGADEFGGVDHARPDQPLPILGGGDADEFEGDTPLAVDVAVAVDPPSVVPLPSASGLGAVGLAIVGLRRRRTPTTSSVG